MQLHFLGSGAAFSPAFGSNSAYFTHRGRLVLIDCGESVFSALLRSGALAHTTGHIVVLLTHLHSDHVGSLGTLCLYAAERLNRPIILVHPNDEVRTLLRIMGVSASHFDLRASYDEDGLIATPAPVKHLSMRAFSYTIDDGDECVYYSGDTSELPPKTVDALRDGRIARVYQDAMAVDGEPPVNPPHLPLPVLCELIEPSLRERVFLMHFNRDYRAEAEALGFRYVTVRDDAYATPIRTMTPAID